jgi:hypothetical protein
LCDASLFAFRENLNKKKHQIGWEGEDIWEGKRRALAFPQGNLMSG